MGDNYTEQWLALYELFDSVSGLKLRLSIPDTVLLQNGRIVGWFHTNRDGVVQRASSPEISPQALFQKLTSGMSVDPGRWPGYLATAHYASGVCRPLKRDELSQILSMVAGPYETPLHDGGDVELPFCIQSYITPIRDMRYICSLGGPDGNVCTVFARRYSARYTHAFDDSSATAARLSSHASASTRDDESDVPPLTAEEMLVESQLVAMGLLEPRQVSEPGPPSRQDSGADVGGSGPSPDAALPASRKTKVAIQKAISVLASFVERAHGLRMQGMVCEFIQASTDTYVMTGVHAVQWDTRASRGRLGTFTDRWSDFLNGMGPAPAVRPPGKKHMAPSLLRTSGDSPLSMTERSIHSAGRSPPLSPANVQGNDVVKVFPARPGSAPTMVFQRFRGNPHFPVAANSAQNGNYTTRNQASASRRGAGGNPTTAPPNPMSYALWAPREALATDTVTGSLALELELTRERLQRQTDIAARAEAALAQLAATGQTTQHTLVHQLEAARSEAEHYKGELARVEGEYERLRSERGGLKSETAVLAEELRSVRVQLDQDRATLATTVRQSQSKEGVLEDLVAKLRLENEQLQQQVGALARKSEEDLEVMEAVKAQLYDYRQMVVLLQGQLRRGKNKPAGAPLIMPGGGGGAAPSAAAMPMQASSALQRPTSKDQEGTAALDGEFGMGSSMDFSNSGNAALGSRRNSMRPSSGQPAAPITAGAPAARRGLARINTLTLSSTPSTSAPGTQPPVLTPRSAAVVMSAPSTSYGGGYSASAPQQQTHGQGPVTGTAFNALRSSFRDYIAFPSGGGNAEGAGPGSGGAAGYGVGVGGAGGAAFSTAIVLSTPAGPPGKLDPVLEGLLGDVRKSRQATQGISPDVPLITPPQPKTSYGDVNSDPKGPPISRSASPSRADVIRTYEPWRPNYDSIVITDLFCSSNEITERMLEVQAQIVQMIEVHEHDFLEVFNFYATIKSVRVSDNKMTMNLAQLNRLALEVGITQEDAVDDLFKVVAEKAMSFEDVGRGEEYITFELFPETVCRLGAARYDWRPPESAEEAEDDIEVPETLKRALREAHQVRAVPTRLEMAAAYAAASAKAGRLFPQVPIRPPSACPGFDPIASPAPVPTQPSAQQELMALYGGGANLPPTSVASPRPGSPSHGRSPHTSSPGHHHHPSSSGTHTPMGMQRPGTANTYTTTYTGDGSEHNDLEGEPVPPMPTDMVLLTMVKHFITYDLLPKARRYKTSGSLQSKQKKGERTAPKGKWL